MRCNECAYPLWNITSRQCPECGKGFNPAEYEFLPGLVQFCCPACNQAYYGTDERGQMVPSEFVCAGCNAPMSAAVAVVRLKPGAREADATKQELPWLERSRRGFFSAWWGTFKLSIVSPRIMMRRTSPKSSGLQAAWYSLLSILIFMVPQVVTLVGVFLIAVAAFAGGRGGGRVSMAFAGGTGLFVLVVAGSMFVSLLLWIVSAHVLLRLTGKVQGPMRRTAHALCYSTGANFLIAVPLLGMYLSVFASAYWLVLAVVMLAEAQRVQVWRAVLAAMIAPLLIGAGVFVTLFAGLLPAMSLAATTQAMQQVYAMRLADLGATIEEAQIQTGAWPAHALDLPPVEGRSFVPMLVLDDQDILLPGLTAADMMALGADAQREHIDALTASLPGRVLAVRVGRIVTVYHGLTEPASAGVWLMFRIEEQHVDIYNVRGPKTNVLRSQFNMALAAQNAARATVGLPPLPQSVIDLEPGEHLAWPEE
jgi:hypothetical protein